MTRISISAYLIFIFSSLFSLSVAAEDAAIQSRSEKLKEEVIQLNRELHSLEERLLHPADTQVAIYLSVDTPSPFVLDSVELKIDGRVATSHLYTAPEVKALARGGKQKLYVGNVGNGPHKIEVAFNGEGVNDHYFRRESAFSIDKDNSSKQIEVIITNTKKSFEPELKHKEWR
ncbi:MAG: AraC family transcriptional regulator [Hahellaceae bacterium]|nr:AraC family transcriptional regulator [Hahellaceae bacterium]